MTQLLKLPVLLLFTCLSQVLMAQTPQTHQDTLLNLVDQYYALNLQIFQANSSADQIDTLFDLFTEDFTYVHPKYGGTYSRKDLYDGYIRNLENGAYNGSIIDIKVNAKITGLNAVAVEKQFISKKDGKTKEGASQMTLFEFKDGKIARINEFW